MAATSSVVRTQVGHEDIIHDAQLDYYGLRLATCSSDRLVKVFNVSSENGAAPKVEFVCDLLGHTGPVWEVAWAHPRWGTLLASCGYEGLVIVHRLSEANAWEETYRFSAKGSVNSIEWCPYEYGLALACASSDGNVYVLRCDPTTGEWTCDASIQTQPFGCHAVTWAPYGALGSLSPDGSWVLRLACGGADAKVKIYKCVVDQSLRGQWEPETELSFHKGMVRDVAWAPSIGLPYNLIASCSEDGTACIWSQESEEGAWKREDLPDFKAPVWRVAWSVTGSLLAVSSGDADVSLWKESLTEKRWMKISEVKDKAAAGTVPSEAPAPIDAPQQQQQMEKAKPRSASLDHPAQAQPPAGSEEFANNAPADISQPQTTWEGIPASSVSEPAAAGTDQQQTASETAVPSEQTAADAHSEQQQTTSDDPNAAASSAQDQQQQQGEMYAAGDYGGYDPNQQYGYDDPNQQQYYSQEGGYYSDPSQQQQGWDNQGQYAGGEGWDPNNAQQQQWDPNQQQQQWGDGQYWSEHQQPSGEAGYADASGQGSWDYANQQQPTEGGLAAPPYYAGAMSQPNQPPAQWGAPGQDQQQSW